MNKQLMEQKKGQSGGLITSLVFGIASLVIGVIIAFVIVSTLTGAGLLEGNRVSNTVTNETGVWLNHTDYPTNVAGQQHIALGTFAVASVVNKTNSTGVATSWTTVAAANYTINSTGWLKKVGGPSANYTDTLNMSYTFLNLTNEEISTSAMSANFTGGIDNVSTKIPTVLLVAAIVLILGALAILVGVWQKMRMGSGSL